MTYYTDQLNYLEVFNKLRWFVAVTLQWFWNKYTNHLCWKYDTLEHASLLLCIFQMIVTRGASSLVSSNTNQNWFQNCSLLWPSLAWYCDTDQQLSHPRSVQFRIWQRQHESKVNMFLNKYVSCPQTMVPRVDLYLWTAVLGQWGMNVNNCKTNRIDLEWELLQNTDCVLEYDVCMTIMQLSEAVTIFCWKRT